MERKALLSIHPEFADAILDGIKGIEFRRRALAPDISKVLIYSTSPIKAIIGEFEIMEQVIYCPQYMWAKYGEIGGIDRKRFFAYFEGTKTAVGFIIQNARRFDRPESLPLGVKAPMSFLYL
jgi:predicted transcriptional regulator